MTAVLALVRTDLILFLSDRRRLLVSTALPIVIAAFFGYLFGGSGDSKTGKIDVALVLLDSGASSGKIAANLKADPALHVTPMDLQQAQQEVRKGRQQAAIVIPSGFGDAAGSALFGRGTKPEIRVLYDPSQGPALAMVKGILAQQVMQVVSAEMFGGKAGEDFAERSLRELEGLNSHDPDSTALRDMLVGVRKYQTRAQEEKSAADGVAATGLAMPFSTSEEQVSSSPMQGYNGYAHSFAGMSVQFILFMGVDMGIGILLSQRSGIWNRFLAAPVALSTVLLARIASTAIIAFGLMCVVFAVAVAVFGVHIASLAGFAGVTLCFALFTGAFGLLIAAFGKTPEAARGIAMFVTLLMVMLGGAWVPSFMFPQWVQQVALAMPTRWAIDGLDGVTWRGLGMDAAVPAMAAELGFALLFAVLAIWKFRRDQK